MHALHYCIAGYGLAWAFVTYQLVKRTLKKAESEPSLVIALEFFPERMLAIILATCALLALTWPAMLVVMAWYAILIAVKHDDEAQSR